MPGFLDYARHAGFLPRLCQPYRAQTKGKVERFIGYLKRSFWVPFVASMRQAGVEARQACGQCGRGALAARGCERARARDDRRGAGRTAHDRARRSCRRCRRPMAGDRARSLRPSRRQRKRDHGLPASARGLRRSDLARRFGHEQSPARSDRGAGAGAPSDGAARPLRPDRPDCREAARTRATPTSWRTCCGPSATPGASGRARC